MSTLTDKTTRSASSSSLSTYFLLVVVSFGVLSLLFNISAHDDWPTTPSTLRVALEQSLGGQPHKPTHPGPPQVHFLAGLNCAPYGGPADTSDWVYWRDIPVDALHVSPFHRQRRRNNQTEDDNEWEEYLTFEPDEGGFNNIRMAMETILALAFAMGRTLVLPPEQQLYLLKQKDHGQKSAFTFNDFFHMESIHTEHAGLNIITMQEFLQRTAGKLRDATTGQPVLPPHGRTNFNGEPKTIFAWLRQHMQNVVWNPDDCLAAFPADTSREAVLDLQKDFQEMLRLNPQFEDFVGRPVPVNAPTLERLKEARASRDQLCLYDAQLQAASVLHFPVDRKAKARLLVNPYQFLFFQDYRHDLWMKRFIRDHVRYSDEIQCAGARVVQAIRQRAQAYNPSNTAGVFDSIHVRRGDFQYKKTRVTAAEIYRMTKRQLPENTTLYIATDEKDKGFFDDLRQHYHILFLDDFAAELGSGMNSNFYGMIDQLVAARGRYFFGTWFSTFTAYINRLRGYIHDLEKKPGYEQGIIDSWYHVLPDRYDHMRTYYPNKKVFYAREFPTAWRLIDSDLEEFHKEVQALRKTSD